MALNEMYEIFSDICSKHGDTQDMFCMDCNEKICLICGRQDHINHNWSRAAIILGNLRSELQEQRHIIKNKRIPLLQAEIKKIKSLKKENMKLATAIEEKIWKHLEVLEGSLQKNSDQLISSCRNLKEEGDEKLDNKEKEIMTYLAEFESCFNKMQENEFTGISQLLELKTGLSRVSEPLKLADEDVTLEKVTFQEGGHVESALLSMIGEISLHYKNITFTKIFAARRGERDIKYISPLTETLAWFREVGTADHIMINIKKNNTDDIYRYTTSNFQYFPEDFITLNNGMHVFTCHSHQCVIKMSLMCSDIEELTPATFTKLADISPLFPVGICTTATGYYLLTAIDTLALSKDIYSIKQPKTSVVLVITDKGKIKQVYQYANDEKTKLFFYPYRIAENSNGDICVIDRTQADSGHICVLSSSGKFKFLYNGSNQKSKFSPFGICCDAFSNILISDNKCVHLVNKSGEFLTYLAIADVALRSLSMFNSTLWIGGTTGFVYVYRYELSDS